MSQMGNLDEAADKAFDQWRTEQQMDDTLTELLHAAWDAAIRHARKEDATTPEGVGAYGEITGLTPEWEGPRRLPARMKYQLEAMIEIFELEQRLRDIRELTTHPHHHGRGCDLHLLGLRPLKFSITISRQSRWGARLMYSRQLIRECTRPLGIGGRRETFS